MHHAFIDSYADLNTPLHKLGSKLKVILLAFFLLLIVLSPIRHSVLFLFYALWVIFLVYLSKVPLRFIFRRIIEIAPFIFVIALPVLFKKEGFILFLNCTVKATLAIILILIVSSTTKFHHLLQALKQLKLPAIFIKLLAFMYHYSFLLEDEFLRAKRAFTSRNINDKNNFQKVKILGNILGNVFIHTYERAERVYLAMCARGYDYEKSN